MLSRSLQNHWIYENKSYLKLWIDLLFRCQFQDSSEPVILGRKEHYLKRGECLLSQSNWAKDTKISESTIKRFLSQSIKFDMIEKINRRPQASWYKVINYSKYQGFYEPTNDLNSGRYIIKKNKGNKEKGIIKYKFGCNTCDYYTLDINKNLSMSCPSCETSLMNQEIIDT